MSNHTLRQKVAALPPRKYLPWGVQDLTRGGRYDFHRTVVTPDAALDFREAHEAHDLGLIVFVSRFEGAPGTEGRRRVVFLRRVG